MDKIDELLTVGQVAQEKGVSREAVRQAVKAGTLAPTRTVLPLLFARMDVELWTPHMAIMRRRKKEANDAR